MAVSPAGTGVGQKSVQVRRVLSGGAERGHPVSVPVFLRRVFVGNRPRNRNRPIPIRTEHACVTGGFHRRYRLGRSSTGGTISSLCRPTSQQGTCRAAGRRLCRWMCIGG